VTFMVDEALDFCDFVARGEGEDTLLELVDHLRGRRELEGIAGLSYRGADGDTSVSHELVPTFPAKSFAFAVSLTSAPSDKLIPVLSL